MLRTLREFSVSKEAHFLAAASVKPSGNKFLWSEAGGLGDHARADRSGAETHPPGGFSGTRIFRRNFLYQKKGFEKIGFIGEATHYRSFFERFMAFRDAMYLYGLPIEEQYCITETHPDDKSYINYLQNQLSSLPHMPELWICANDFAAGSELPDYLHRNKCNLPGVCEIPAALMARFENDTLSMFKNSLMLGMRFLLCTAFMAAM